MGILRKKLGRYTNC